MPSASRPPGHGGRRQRELSLYRRHRRPAQLQPAFDWIEPKNQHTGQLRPTAAQSRRIAANYLENIKLKFRLYPDLIGLHLIGRGFADAPADVDGGHEVWTLNITGTPTGGTFTLRFFSCRQPAVGWQTTATIPYDPDLRADRR